MVKNANFSDVFFQLFPLLSFVIHSSTKSCIFYNKFLDKFKAFLASKLK